MFTDAQGICHDRQSRIDRRTRRKTSRPRYTNCQRRAPYNFCPKPKLPDHFQSGSCRFDVRLRRAEFVRRDKDFARKFPDDIRRREYRICADCSLNFSICSADACALPDYLACSSKQYRRFYSKLRGFRGAANLRSSAKNRANVLPLIPE